MATQVAELRFQQMKRQRSSLEGIRAKLCTAKKRLFEERIHSEDDVQKQINN